MADQTIPCPQCKAEIRLTDALARPLIEKTRQEYEQRLAEVNAQSLRREKLIHEREQAVARSAETLDQRLADQLRVERQKIAAEESRKARDLLAADMDQKALELSALQKILEQNNLKLAEAQKAQAEVIRKERALDDARRELDLSVETRVQESLAKVRQEAQKSAEERQMIKLAEREQTIAAMQKQIEELRQKAEQGSQQLQGEVLELRLETLLRERFPFDKIEPVPKGQHGGDVLQRIMSGSGRPCVVILWETKRTKNWTDSWLAKLRDDQRAAHADIAILISHALPKEITSFDQVDGVWVSDLNCAMPVALALRHALIEIAAARQSVDGQQTKTALVYQYLTGPRFRQRIQAIVEKFDDMRSDLDKERKSMTRLWAKREEQINGVLGATAGLWGDLEGIAGQSLQEIDGLSIPLLDGSVEP